MKERLDVLLVKRGLAVSREKAKAVIMSGCVYVENQTAGHKCNYANNSGNYKANNYADNNRNTYCIHFSETPPFVLFIPLVSFYLM